MYACICMHVDLCICMCVCMCVYMYVCIYVCVYVCMYVCVYVCMHNILGGNCPGGMSYPKREGVLSWGIVRGVIVPRELSRGSCPTPLFSTMAWCGIFIIIILLLHNVAKYSTLCTV